MSPRACGLSLALLTPLAHGAEPNPGLTGKAEFGYLATSGNTDTSSLNAKLDLKFETGPWRHSLLAAAISARDSGVTTAERNQLSVKSDRKFTEHDYVFATVNWEQDEFAGFTQRTSEAFGYGHRKLRAEAHHVELEIGIGAAFDQSLIMEKGNSNTYTAVGIEYTA